MERVKKLPKKKIFDPYKFKIPNNFSHVKKMQHNKVCCAILQIYVQFSILTGSKPGTTYYSTKLFNKLVQNLCQNQAAVF
ncbi:hypothetical protein BpHYR1_052680 [Brachionus plicatilis]|uniref:Uncharacterized protein n=1 Tax=Brachionus plicatilis TaxID=10195 RepID=A0A3M7Q3W8_BRAPC|nr:hypothetical protein BpHYR1_052680 [Brachionus plicatilis]